jgi:U4/U6 small nuclear ribonucleoprotein PRP4
MRQPGDRRDRLKYVQEQMEMARGGSGMAHTMDDSESDDSDDEGEFFTEGTDDLLAARRKLAAYSLQR